MVLRGHGGREIQDESITGADIKDGSILPVDVDFSTQSAIKSYPTLDQSVLANTVTKLNVDGVLWDNQLEYDSVNSQFTIKKSGVYIVTGLVTVETAYDNMRTKIMVYVSDGASTPNTYTETLGDTTHSLRFVNDSTFTVEGATLIKFNKGDIASFRIISTHDIKVIKGVGKTNFILVKII